MKAYFLYKAAAQFAALKVEAAEQVVDVLLQIKSAPDADTTGLATQLIGPLCTANGGPWVSAFAEGEEVTVVDLGEPEAEEAFALRVSALASADRRPTVGGVSLDLPTARLQETVRILVQEEGRLTNAVAAAPASTSRLVPALCARAHRWRTTELRRDLRQVLEQAVCAPQLIEREGRELLLIDRELLERFDSPLSAAALAEQFANNRLAPLDLTSVTERAPEPALQLGRIS